MGLSHLSVAGRIYAAFGILIVLLVVLTGVAIVGVQALGANFADEGSKAEFLEVIQAEHQRVFGAITDRKPDEARVAMRRHLEDGRRRYRDWSLAQDETGTG